MSSKHQESLFAQHDAPEEDDTDEYRIRTQRNIQRACVIVHSIFGVEDKTHATLCMWRHVWWGPIFRISHNNRIYGMCVCIFLNVFAVCLTYVLCSEQSTHHHTHSAKCQQHFTSENKDKLKRCRSVRPRLETTIIGGFSRHRICAAPTAVDDQVNGVYLTKGI